MNQPIQNLKSELRQNALAGRDSLDPIARVENSLSACGHGLAAISPEPGGVVSGFWPIRSEIDPRPFMFELQKRGTRICLPVVLDKTTIEFRRLTPDCQLIETGFGTKGPGPGAEILNPQILLIPLAAFDRHGGRIGYGAGFYDRAIEKLQKKGPSPLLVGFAFSCQEVEKVPMEPHDQHLNIIITETGLIEVKQAKESIA